MTKRELWESFIKTGSVKDYLRYQRAQDRELFDADDEELSEELSPEETNGDE